MSQVMTALYVTRSLQNSAEFPFKQMYEKLKTGVLLTRNHQTELGSSILYICIYIEPAIWDSRPEM